MIYVDADACPVKEETIRVAERFGAEVFLVSNQGSWTRGRPRVHSVLVDAGFDAADNWIAERAGPADVVITADIPLAARCVKAGALVLSHAGRPFTESSIGAALAMRDLNAHLRETGESKGYNKAFTKEDRSRFLQALDEALRKAASVASSATLSS